MDATAVIEEQLINAVQENDLAQLREILLQKNENLEQNRGRGRESFVATDNNISQALHTAVLARNIEACRLLFNRLSSSGKKEYKVVRTLHVAASEGFLEIVRLFSVAFKVNINQRNFFYETPLSCAVARNQAETTRFLLENGVNPNRAGDVHKRLDTYDMFWNVLVRVVRENLHFSVNLCQHPRLRLLLDDVLTSNMIRRLTRDDQILWWRTTRLTDYAILNGNTEILSLLLQHGAMVGNRDAESFALGTSLNLILYPSTRRPREITRETKLEICQILVEHSTAGEGCINTALFLQSSLESYVKNGSAAEDETGEILLESGLDPRRGRAIYVAIQQGNEAACRLLVQHGVDPFLSHDDDDDGNLSPFLAAARQEDTSILLFFLELWDERFSSSNGKNSDGDYPIHVLCCDPKVSLEAIRLVATRQPDTLVTVDGEQGLLPFHFAAMWDAKLDLIFALLKHCPDALFFLRQHHALPSVVDRDGSQMLDGSDAAADGEAEVSNIQGGQNHSLETDDGPPLQKKAKTTH